MADKVLLKHEAPPLDDVQQGLLEGSSVHFEPDIKHQGVLDQEEETKEKRDGQTIEEVEVQVYIQTHRGS